MTDARARVVDSASSSRHWDSVRRAFDDTAPISVARYYSQSHCRTPSPRLTHLIRVREWIRRVQLRSFAENLHRTLLRDTANGPSPTPNPSRSGSGSGSGGTDSFEEPPLTCVSAITKLFEHVAMVIDQQTKVRSA